MSKNIISFPVDRADGEQTCYKVQFVALAIAQADTAFPMPERTAKYIDGLKVSETLLYSPEAEAANADS